MSSGLSSAAATWRQAQVGARTFRSGTHPVKLLGGGLAVADILLVTVASVSIYQLRNSAAEFSPEIAWITVFAAVLTLNTMGLSGCYTRHVTASFGRQASHAAKGWSAAFAILLLIGYLTRTASEFSRLWAAGWYLTVLLGVIFVRLIAVAKVRRWREQGRISRIVAVVDLSGAGAELARGLLQASGGEMRLVGVFAPERAVGRNNSVSDLVALARLFRIDEVIVAVTGERDGITNDIIRKLGTIPAHVRLCPEVPRLTVQPREAGLLFGQAMLTVYRHPLTDWNRVLKRTEDIVLSSLALILLAPLMLLLAALVKLDSAGPVIFRQQRLGFNNNVINVYKFRSMVHDAEPDGDAGVPQATRNDARVTRLGRLLRRSSLDELPQLLNVLQGKMSLVGPRPHALAHNDQYAALIDGYLGRHRVQPGITGWAQVNGFRGETETLDKMERRVEHDLVYTDNWSLGFDLRILLMTVLLPLFDRNAY